MPDVEGFSDVDGRIIDADSLSAAHVRRAERFAFFRDFLKRFFNERRSVYGEIEISVNRFDLAYNFVRIEKVLKFFGNRDGGFSHRFREFEAGESVVSHFIVRRNGDSRLYFFRGDIRRRKFFGDVFSVIHFYVLIL